MRFVKLTIAYDGKNYVGWQIQDNGLSIQACLEKAWLTLTHEKVRITSSGRTDSGVHAEGQVCSVRTRNQLEIRKFINGLNAYLPEDIIVLAAQEMPGEFHAIRDAVGKTYRYQIQSGPFRNVLAREQWWYVPPQLDVEAMRRAAEYLVGRHDFAAFQSLGSKRVSTVRTITEIRLGSREENSYQWVKMNISADGFLYNMARCIVGTLVETGKGKQPPEWCREVLESRNRAVSGATAPAHGLCLVRVQYPPQFM
jgi:tRNA pseudouridine38-40 synthase